MCAWYSIILSLIGISDEVRYPLAPVHYVRGGEIVLVRLLQRNLINSTLGKDSCTCTFQHSFNWYTCTFGPIFKFSHDLQYFIPLTRYSKNWIALIQSKGIGIKRWWFRCCCILLYVERIGHLVDSLCLFCLCLSLYLCLCLTLLIVILQKSMCSGLSSTTSHVRTRLLISRVFLSQLQNHERGNVWCS